MSAEETSPLKLPLTLDDFEAWVQALPKKTYLGKKMSLEDNPLCTYITTYLPDLSNAPEYRLVVGTKTGIISFKDQDNNLRWAEFSIDPELGLVLRYCSFLGTLSDIIISVLSKKLYRERVLKAIKRARQGDKEADLMENFLYVAE